MSPVHKPTPGMCGRYHMPPSAGARAAFAPAILLENPTLTEKVTAPAGARSAISHHQCWLACGASALLLLSDIPLELCCVA